MRGVLKGGGWSNLLNSPTVIQQSFYFFKDIRTLPAEWTEENRGGVWNEGGLKRDVGGF